MTDTTQTPGPVQPITSFPNYGGFFPSFPFSGLSQQFGASMAPFGGGYGGWGMPQQFGGMGGYPSLFGGGYMPQQFGGMGGYGNPFGSMGGMPGMYGGGYGQQPFGGMGGSLFGAAQQAPQQAPQQPMAQAQQPSPQPSAPQPAAPMTQPSWSAAQLAQANGLSPGLADYMLAHNQGGSASPANQQFYQAAGFTNPTGSQTLLNQAGRNWITNNDQSYGNINADAGQTSPTGRLGYGMEGNTPYSYSLGQAATNPALQQWLIKARSGQTNIGPPPTGATLYSQFGGG